MTSEFYVKVNFVMFYFRTSQKTTEMPNMFYFYHFLRSDNMRPLINNNKEPIQEKKRKKNNRHGSCVLHLVLFETVIGDVLLSEMPWNGS